MIDKYECGWSSAEGGYNAYWTIPGEGINFIMDGEKRQLFISRFFAAMAASRALCQHLNDMQVRIEAEFNPVTAGLRIRGAEKFVEYLKTLDTKQSDEPVEVNMEMLLKHATMGKGLGDAKS